VKINDQSLRQFLRFWRRIPPAERPEESETWQQATKATLERLPDDVLDTLTEDASRAYDEVEAARGSASTRATALLVVVAVLNGLAALTATTLEGAHPILALAYVAVAAALGYFAVGTAFLAIRAQQVTTWHTPHVRPRDIGGARHYRKLRAFEIYTASRLNRHGLRDVIGYLRDAQVYALITIVLLATLTVVAATTSATKPAAPAVPGTPAPSPVVQPTPIESGKPSPTLASSASVTSLPSAPTASPRPVSPAASSAPSP